MSSIEIKIRVHFERFPNDPLTAKQIAQRVGVSEQGAQYKLSELLAEGYVQRRRSLQCMRPYVWIRADQQWPSDISVQPAAAAQ